MIIEIAFSGWIPGMRPIPFIHLLNDTANLSLKESKEVKDNVVNGIPTVIRVLDIDIANRIVIKSRELGVICAIRNSRM
jgi:hypothetical protein